MPDRGSRWLLAGFVALAAVTVVPVVHGAFEYVLLTDGSEEPLHSLEVVVDPTREQPCSLGASELVAGRQEVAVIAAGAPATVRIIAQTGAVALRVQAPTPEEAVVRSVFLRAGRYEVRCRTEDGVSGTASLDVRAPRE